MHTITIIGGGASGTLLAIQLIRLNQKQPLTIHLVESRPQPGRGVAYSAASLTHRLNVPAGKMSAFPQEPEHFHRWLLSQGHALEADAFVPRRWYGDYLAALLEESLAGNAAAVTLQLHQDEAVDVSHAAGGLVVQLASGQQLPSDQVVLAFGNFLPPHLRGGSQEYLSHPGYQHNPWDPQLVDKVPAEARVLIIGIGLTAVDTILSLHEARHRGPIQAISTHGWAPAVHELGHSYPSFSAELAGKTSVRELLRIVRRHLALAQQNGSNWRAVVDALRPDTQALWQGLPLAEKRRFMRHLRRLWDVARHRLPAECAAVLSELEAAGQLQRLTGRIQAIQATPAGLQVSYRQHGQQHQREADIIINCTGSESRLARLEQPLLRNLLARRLIRPDALGLGLQAQPDGWLGPGLYTLGTALKGILWESTAIPEIRSQAQHLAARLLAGE